MGLVTLVSCTPQNLAPLKLALGLPMLAEQLATLGILTENAQPLAAKLSLPNKGHRSDGAIYPIFGQWQDGPGPPGVIWAHGKC